MFTFQLRRHTAHQSLYPLFVEQEPEGGLVLVGVTLEDKIYNYVTYI
jgi:hypothetical protein